MNAHAFTSMILACIFLALAAAFVWIWCIPIFRSIAQKSIEPLLIRAGNIGFNEQLMRKQLFVGESIMVGLLVWGTLVYMGWILGLTVICIAYHLRGLLLAWVIESRERMLRSQTLSFTSALQGLVRGGMTLAPAVETLSRETPAPLGTQINRISTEFRRGRPLMESLNEARETLRLDAFSLLVTSIVCALKQGASLQASLAGVQEALEHRDHSERQMFAKTSGARSTILILACTPPGFFIIFWLMMSGSMQLIFTTDDGKLLLASILGLMYVGIAWARRLLVLK
jgi:tight adherence protein B